MNGSLMAELIDTYYWDIVDDFLYSEGLGEEVDKMEDTQKELLIANKKDKFNTYAQVWISENC